MPDERQIAYERHTRQFEEHVKHFEQIDDVLQDFARVNGFALEKNQLHRPCRILRRKDNPHHLIEIAQEGEWEKVLYREDLPHTIAVIGYAVDEKQEFVYRMYEEVAYFVHFSTIESNLQQYLKTALAHLQKWTRDTILRDGAQSRHPSAYYREHGGLKVQIVE